MVAAAARKPETRDVGQYDPWNDPVYVQWERQQIEDQEKLAAKAKAQVQPNTPEATQLSQLVSNIDQRKDNFANQGAVNVQQALWQPLSAQNSPMQSGVSFGLKSGGAVTVHADQISYDKAAAKDIIAIETGILSMKAQNHASVVIGGADESFKANAWAYAQLHGLDVQGYVPTPEARALAAQLKSQRQGLNNVGDAPFGAPAGVMRAATGPDLRVVVDNTGANPTTGADAARQAFYNGAPPPKQAAAPQTGEPKAGTPAGAETAVALNEAQQAQLKQMFAQQVVDTSAEPIIKRHRGNMVDAQRAAAGKPDDSPEAAAARKTAGTYQEAFDNRVNQGMGTAVRDLNVDKATREAFGAETKKALVAHHAAAGAPESQQAQFDRLFAQQVGNANAEPIIKRHRGNMINAQRAADGKPDDSPEAAAARKTAGTYQFAFDNRVNNGMDTAVRDLSVDKATRDAFAAQTRVALADHHANSGGQQGDDGTKTTGQRVTVDPAANAGGRHRFGALRQEAAAAVDVTAAGKPPATSLPVLTEVIAEGDQIPEFLRKGPATAAERRDPPGVLEQAANRLRGAVDRARSRRPGNGGPSGAG